MRLILASASPRRAELLRAAGYTFETIVTDVDEQLRPGETPVEYVRRLAAEKSAAALEVVARPFQGRERGAESPALRDVIILGADTTVVVDGDVLGKPRDEAQASEMLRRLSGRSHAVMTGVAVRWRGRVASGVEEVGVTFRALGDDEIARYIATREPMDKAGAYGIQGFGATIVSRVDGDYFAVMGLALGKLVSLCRQVGLRYDFGPLAADE